MTKDEFTVNRIIHGDVIEVLETFPDCIFSAVVTDPPYGLSKEPDMREVLKHWLEGDDYEHKGGGFMGKKWDSFVPGPKVWEQIIRVMLPGAHMFSFGGTRTFDLMTTAMRIAGYIMRDKIDYYFDQTGYMSWSYGCLSEDAEILTEQGWLLGTEVEEGDVVAMWDSKTESIRLGPVEKKIISSYDGDMIAFVNDNTDQLLTPNHRVYKRSRIRKMQQGVRHSWFEDKWNVQLAGDISRWNVVFVPLAGWHDGPGLGGQNGDDLDYAALLGWVWTEGGFDRHGTGVRLYQSSVNQHHVDTISALVNKMVPGHSEYQRQRTYKGREYTEHCWFFTGSIADRLRVDLPDKHPTWSLLWRMTQNEKQAFLEAALAGDGGSRKNNGSWAFYQNDFGDLEWFQMLCHCVGMQGRINERKRCVALHDNPVTQFQCRHLKANYKVPYSGLVWCIQVETGAFVARRNGKVFITGNSGFPKGLNIGKAINKMKAAERKVVAENSNHGALSGVEYEGVYAGGNTGAANITAPETDEAKKWEGYDTALKPAHEPIAVFGKSGKTRREKCPYCDGHGRHGVKPYWTTTCKECEASTDGKETKCPACGSESVHHLMTKLEKCGVCDGKGWINVQDGAGAPESMEAPLYYCAKAPKKERNWGCDELYWRVTKGGMKPIDKAEFDKVTEEKPKGVRVVQGNCWPTVKPLELMRYLVRMVKMPERNLILDPFCGSGTTMMACILEGIDYIGIDSDANACRIAEARCKYAREHRDEILDLMQKKEEKRKASQEKPKEKS